MDWLNETSPYMLLAPQLTWIKIIEVCAVILLALALLLLVVGKRSHLASRIHLWALLPLVPGMVVAIIAFSLHNTYVYWVNFLDLWLPRSFPLAFQTEFLREIAAANQTATVLGRISVSVTGILLALSLLVVWRAMMPRRQTQLPASLNLDTRFSAEKGHQG